MAHVNFPNSFNNKNIDRYSRLLGLAEDLGERVNRGIVQRRGQKIAIAKAKPVRVMVLLALTASNCEPEVTNRRSAYASLPSH